MLFLMISVWFSVLRLFCLMVFWFVMLSIGFMIIILHTPFLTSILFCTLSIYFLIWSLLTWLNNIWKLEVSQLCFWNIGGLRGVGECFMSSLLCMVRGTCLMVSWPKGFFDNFSREWTACRGTSLR
uniref:Uncharacterized protein n=1 Tax=Eutreptiella gymnastica TaxID=73025 RepID=A0A7S1IFI5_9EUGL